jgi:hypothetical protein
MYAAIDINKILFPVSAYSIVTHNFKIVLLFKKSRDCVLKGQFMLKFLYFMKNDVPCVVIVW